METGNSVVLHREVRSDFRSVVTASVEGNGKVVVHAGDFGDRVKTLWGAADYSYDVTIPVEAKDRLILVLLEKLYAGNVSAVDDLQELLNRKQVPYHFDNWVSYD